MTNTSTHFFISWVWVCFFAFSTISARAEGTKELMPDSASNKRAFILIANGSSGGNLRDPFALYNGDTNYRLKIHISDHVKEKIYFGIGAISGTGSSVTWRVHKPNGSIAWAGTTPTNSSQQGFIQYYSQAYNGPKKLDPLHGYNALVVDPDVNGDYFMTFQVSNSNSRSYEKIDISVIDTTTVNYKKGRVFSKAWQLNTNDPSAHGFFGKLFVYTNDGVVNRFDPNGFDGRWFTVSCNESGCYPISPTHNAQQARQSVTGWHNYPQYIIFLNDPDTNVYPSGIVGQLVPNSLSTVSYCDNGTIDFIFETTALGTAEITLELHVLGSYSDRILIESVSGGIDTVSWDGKDGNGLSIPNGASFPFTMRYYNGLTHLPLWDVEGNSNGFKVNLVRPQSVPAIPDPEFFWDDSQVGGASLTTIPGCVSTPTTGCHSWNGDWGDNKTINTWWFVVSTSTQPVVITYKVGPKPLGGISGPTALCQGAYGFFSVTSDPNSEQYHWTWPGGEDTTTASSINLQIPPGTTPGSVQITVHGINSECGAGPISTKTITINQIPSVTNNPTMKSICSGNNSGITLTSDVVGAGFSWRAYCSNPAITGFTNGSSPTISNILVNTGFVTDTVRYRIVAIASGCIGDSITYKVAVHPVPNLSNNPLAKSQCNNLNTAIPLNSNINGTLFTWVCTPSSSNITGYSDQSFPTDSINQTLINTGYSQETVTYRITPQANGCNGNLTNYVVTVFPTPDLSNTPLSKEICNGQLTDIALTSHTQNTLFTWTCTQTSGNVTGWSDNPGPPTNGINQSLILSGYLSDTVIYHITPHANSCNGVPEDYLVIINPVPEVTVQPLVDSICSESTTNIVLTASVTGTNFSWTAAPGVGSVTGFSDGNTPLISQTLINPLSTPGSVIYTITPNTGSCTGNSTVFTMWVKPTPHVTNTPSGDTLCNGQTTGLTLLSDVTGTLFTWTATSSSGNVTGFSDSPAPTTFLNQTLVNSGYAVEWVNYQITPAMNGCIGPDSNYVFSVNPVPDLTNNPLYKDICSGQSPGVLLQSNVSGTLFTWTATGSSVNVTGFSDQSAPTDLIDQPLQNTGVAIETVTYHLTPHANSCSGIIWDYVITVYPVANLSNVPLSKSQCNQTATNITLTSDVANTLFTWTTTPSSGNVSGFSNSIIPAASLNQTLNNTGFAIETVTYHILPMANGCDGTLTDYIVTIFPTPDLSNNPPSSQVCNNAATGVTLESNITGTTFTWTCTPSSANVTGWSNNPSNPTTILNQILVNNGLAVETVTYHMTPSANGCTSPITDYLVTVVQSPDVFFVPNGQTICSSTTSNFLLQSSVPGTTFNWTTLASSPTLTGYSDGAGDVIAQSVTNSGTTIETVTYTVYPTAWGCPPGVPQPVVLTVNPKPVVTNTVTMFQQCSAATTHIIPESSVFNSTFVWRASGSSPQVAGFSDGAGLTIVQTLINSGFSIETVTFRIAAVANTCTGDSVDFTVTVFPVADVYFSPNSQTICSGESCLIQNLSHVSGTTYAWIATGSDPEVSGFANGNGEMIQQTLFNSGYMIPDVTYQVTPSANGCTGTSSHVIVTVNPNPDVTFNHCFDAVTSTDAIPFTLHGGIPVGGVYSGPGISGGTFYPAIAGAGTHSITYSYSNGFGCTDYQRISITLTTPVSHTCGSLLTDIRDNTQYPTILIGSQCWMASNLNYGTPINSAQMQRDNCISEKYCYHDLPANCNQGGTLYQWDEVMRYVSSEGTQGFCPPGWHIPTETEWNTLFNFYISNGFAGSPLKYNGYSGFDAMLQGIRFNNSIWKFGSGSTVLRANVFWSSTFSGADKAWAHGMNEVILNKDYTPSVSFYSALRFNAFSIRCIKD